MNRMRRFIGLGAALALVALVIMLGTESGAIAQVVRAALVRNQDEPGRNPYSQNAGCFGRGCSLTFSPVPAGQRLVVTFVNAVVEGSNGTPLVLGGHALDTRYLATTNDMISVVNSPVLAYYDAGETPTLTSAASENTLLGSTLSGYFIALP